MTPLNLLNLPPELLSHIVSYLLPEPSIHPPNWHTAIPSFQCSPSALIPISQVSKSFREITCEHWFSNLTCVVGTGLEERERNERGQGEDGRDEIEDGFERRRNKILKVENFEKLGVKREKVKEFWCTFEVDAEEEEEEEEGDGRVSNLMTTTKRSKSQLGSQVLSRILKDMKRLKSLGISWRAQGIADFQISTIFSKDQGHRMESLKQLWLSFDDGEDGTTCLKPLTFLDLQHICNIAPNLSHLTVENLHDNPNLDSSSPSQPSTFTLNLSPLTHLALYDPALSPSSLSQLFQAISPTLQAFTLIHPSPNTYSRTCLAQTLEPILETLESFYFKATWGHFEGILDDIIPKMKNLKHLVESGGGGLRDRGTIKKLPRGLETIALNVRERRWRAEELLKGITIQVNTVDVKEEKEEEMRRAWANLRRIRILGEGWSREKGETFLKRLSKMEESDELEKMEIEKMEREEEEEGKENVIWIKNKSDSRDSKIQRLICTDSREVKPSNMWDGNVIKKNFLETVHGHVFRKVASVRRGKSLGMEGEESGVWEKWVYEMLPLSVTGNIRWDDTF